MTLVSGGQDRRMRSFVNSAVVGLLLLLTAGCGTIQAEREATKASMQPFNSNAEDAVVLISVETIREQRPKHLKSQPLFVIGAPDPDTPWDAMYRLTFASSGPTGEGKEAIERKITYMPITSMAYETSYGVRKDRRYYFLFRLPPGAYHLRSQYFFGGVQMFGEELPEGGILVKSLQFTAKKGMVNYAGNLFMQWSEKDWRIVQITHATREIAEAKSVLAESFPHVQAEFRDAQTPNSIVGPSVIWLHFPNIKFNQPG